MGKLSQAMDFDHVIRIAEDESITNVAGIYAPNLYDEELDSDEWEFVTTGYSQQDGYSGPIMHNSELIGGSLERDILSEPGIYCAIVAYWSPEEDEEDNVEGWAIIRYIGDMENKR